MKKLNSIRICRHGVSGLKIFCISSVILGIYYIWLAFQLLPDQWSLFLWSGLACILVESLIFWYGIICVYSASVQLGIKLRVIGILCGMIPIAHLIALSVIIKTVSAEVKFETQKAALNSSRHEEKICGTKYPILLVHGVFFRDFKMLNYWGRIPAELERNGAKIFYGNHQSAASVASSAEELTVRIKEIVKQTGCEKVNIIAHSKGGLDCRWAVGFPDSEVAPYVASLTTINTPHRGCEFADYLLGKIPEKAQQKLAHTYNSALRKLGDQNPDFLAAVADLTASRCAEINASVTDPSEILRQSVGSKLNHAANGKFPLNFTYPLVKYFDGPNDGLVSESSFKWGESYRFLTTEGKRGISHGDVIDLNRENILGFDVREFYVELVADLKKKGL